MTKAEARRRFERIMDAVPESADIQVIHICPKSKFPARDRMDVVTLKDGVPELAERLGAELKTLEINGKIAAYIVERGKVQISQITMKQEDYR